MENVFEKENEIEKSPEINSDDILNEPVSKATPTVSKKKPKKKRKELTEERKEQLRQQLKKGREKSLQKRRENSKNKKISVAKATLEKLEPVVSTPEVNKVIEKKVIEPQENNNTTYLINRIIKLENKLSKFNEIKKPVIKEASEPIPIPKSALKKELKYQKTFKTRKTRYW
tara:strand:- start:705 stop:1220 length:516 start_codon:yes stop_codon:yes gene_type:complete